MPGVDLSDYVEVSERIERFREKHPDGSLQVRFIDVPPPFNEKFIAVEARAYRSPDDERPGIDIAWEPVPGKTPYTTDSEAMNASTSAVGRAIVYALAADAHRSIASANEVRARQYTEGADQQTGFASDKQRDYLRNLLDKADAPDAAGIEAYLEANFSGGREGGISKAIDKLKENPATAIAELDSLAQEWHLQQESDIPKDAADLPDPDQREADDAKQETLT